MSKYYSWCVIYPATLTILLTVLCTIVVSPVDQGADFAGYRLGITLIEIIRLGVLLAILFAPVFLNSRSEIRESPIKRYLSWWLLPGAYLIFLISAAFPIKPGAISLEKGTAYIYIAVVAHIAGSLVGWFLFNKALEKEPQEYDQYKS
ncbi:hypothetical protein ACE38W_01580 [Chitinophaga sp. Hz27]|uniref:hypothetical protein n=1 Tax=Chitinophaga sp. Hz27 TaxID=3347169 RepID=UPI0035DEFE69